LDFPALVRSSFATASACATWTHEIFYQPLEVAPDSKEIIMARYVARFLKRVLGDNGCETEICQRSLDVEAANRTRAAEVAKLKFCESENVEDWQLHADRVQVMEAEFPS
jgi:hypothetical protein